MEIKVFEQELEAKLKGFLDSQETQTIMKATQEDSAYIVRFKITNESVDRDGEIIKAEGIDWKYFDKNPVILIDHTYKVSSIAGKAIKREIVGNETYLDVQLAKGVEAGELVKTLHEQGMIKGVSIGFLTLQRDQSNQKIITKSEALEASFVAIGSNREALVEDTELFKKCVKAGFIKDEEDVEEKVLSSQVNVGDNIAFRRITKYTNGMGIEIVEVYPEAKSLPYLGKVLAKYENGENILNWGETLISGTSENPLLVIQNYVKSKDGPILMTSNVNLVEDSRIQIESVVSQKEVDDGEAKFVGCDEDFDKKEILHNIKSVGESVKTLEQKISSLIDDKIEGETLEKSRKMGQDLNKSLSAWLGELKKVTQ